MPTNRTPTAVLRRTLQTSAQPLTRAEIYERQHLIDNITEMDHHLVQMVAAGQVRQVGTHFHLPA